MELRKADIQAIIKRDGKKTSLEEVQSIFEYIQNGGETKYSDDFAEEQSEYFSSLVLIFNLFLE